MAQLKKLTVNQSSFEVVGPEGIPETVVSDLDVVTLEDGTQAVQWNVGTGANVAARQVALNGGGTAAASQSFHVIDSTDYDGFDFSQLKKGDVVFITQG